MSLLNLKIQGFPNLLEESGARSLLELIWELLLF